MKISHIQTPRHFITILLRFLAAVWLAASLVLAPQTRARASFTSAQEHSDTGGNLLQLQAAGHVLGFQPDKVYLAALDHALSVEFVGSRGVTPQSSTSSEAAGKQAAFQQVTYAGAWEGVSIAYESSPRSVTAWRLSPTRRKSGCVITWRRSGKTMDRCASTSRRVT